MILWKKAFKHHTHSPDTRYLKRYVKQIAARYLARFTAILFVIPELFVRDCL